MSPGLYLHVPFCATVCPYCDFAVLVGDGSARRRYVEGLTAEIRLWGGADRGELGGFDTIYLGGGTPSILEAAQLEHILETIRRELRPADDPRIFLEANPEDVSRERLRAWIDLGVRTLSLGVQSLDPEELGFLGRLHGPDQARRAVELALEAGFATVSLDLIYGLPGQSASAWRRNLEAAVALGPDHLSCYQLTVHRKTVFGVRKRRGELVEMPDDEQADLFLLTHRLLNDAGYQGYEVSNFARSPEHRSRHNMKYWDHTPYLGLGPSAHSFAGRRRWWNQRSLGPWRRAVDAGERPIEDSEELSDRELALERLMLAFRTYDGVDATQLAYRYGLDLASAAGTAKVERLAARKLLTVDGAIIRPTLRGLALADSIARELSP